MEILIKKSAITQDLQSHATTSVDLTFITTDGTDDQAVLNELQSIGVDYSIYSGSASGESGSQSEGIVLPVKAF